MNDSSDTIVINNATIKLTEYKGHISRRFASRSLYYIKVIDTETDELYQIPITSNDIGLFKDRETVIYKIELYSHSHLIKSVRAIEKNNSKEKEV